ncbi:MAG TPA: sigma factor-like helix-turn-helix DNA-binding protein [Solirubrobacteraceae bacterium]|nr:sigma factor-like helix-turn-helix DNA-binding protein [Solirubrobacteraceae bacterium]
MSRLDDLPPDQRAALSLLLLQHKSYAEVATLLQIPAGAVHDRAQAALAVLAPGEARALSADERAEVGDYLLGQSGIAERLKTRTYLSDSEPARTWALAVAGELSALSPNALPEIPAPSANNVHLQHGYLAPPAAAPAPAAPPAGAPASGVDGSGAGAPPITPLPRPAQGTPSSSRLGGILVLAAVVVAVVVAVILLTGGSSKHKHTTSSSHTTAANTKGPTVHQLTLRSPSASSRSLGVVEVLSEAGKRAFYIEAQNLPASRHFFYAIWLYNSPTSAEPLSKAPPVGKSHRLAGGALLPSNAANYKQILLTRETSQHPAHPGKVVLSGPFTLE